MVPRDKKGGRTEWTDAHTDDAETISLRNYITPTSSGDNEGARVVTTLSINF